MASLIPPLNPNVPLTNSDGTPTPLLQRILNRLSITSSSNVSVSAGGAIDLAPQAAKTLLANGQTISAVPSGLTLTQVLDFLSTVRGSVIYRDSSVWKVLAPGTAGQVLQTGGAGANPSWVTPAAGGGGSTTLGVPNTLSAMQTPSVNFYLSRLIIVDSNFTASKVAFEMGSAVPTTQYQPFIYASSAAGAPTTLLGSGPQVTGVTAGYNEAPLSAPVSLTKGQMIFVGCNVATATFTNLWHSGAGLVAFAGNGGSTVPAGTAPAMTTSTLANNIYGFWLVA